MFFVEWVIVGRDSSVVEHLHGKEGVPGSSPGHGSTNLPAYTPLIHTCDVSHMRFVKYNTVSITMVVFNDTCTWEVSPNEY
jgi:hypothetical protein